MITNGKIVYAISRGRLYLVCRGSSSLFFRYLMHAVKISVHMNTPTMSAVTPDHVHRTRIFSACLVTPVGQPNRRSRSTSWAEQPVRSKAAEETMTAKRALP